MSMEVVSEPSTRAVYGEPDVVPSTASTYLGPGVSRRRESAISTTSTDSDDVRCHCCGGGEMISLSAEHCAVGTHGESTLSDGRDSGVEADTFVPPDEETGRCIAEAVEYYFSNENLLKDAFLLKHVKRNKEGYVSLKLIASFKHVKHLNRDWRAVAHSIRYSVQLQLNDEGTKVRRVQPLPEYDETVTSRTIVAVNLPLERPTIASVSQLFGRCGDITSIRVLKPSANVPVEVRAAFNKRPDIVWEGVQCAVVEFERQDHARVARETMTTAIADDDESGMHILPIGKVSNKKKSRAGQEDGYMATRNGGVLCQELEAVSLEAAVAADFETQKKRRQRRKKPPLMHMDSRSSLSGTDGEFSSCGSRRCTPPHQSLFSQPLFPQPPPLLPLPPPAMRLGKRLTPPSTSFPTAAGAAGGCAGPTGALATRSGVGMFHCADIRLTTDHHHHQHHLHQQQQQATSGPQQFQHALFQHQPPPPLGQPPLQTYQHLQQLGMRSKSLSTSSMVSRPTADVTAAPIASAARQKKSHSFSGVPQQQHTSSSTAGTVAVGCHDQCAWMQRRKASGALDQERRGSLVSHDNVMREPRGPDGSRGFGGFGSRRPSRTSTTIAPTIEELPGDEAEATAGMAEDVGSSTNPSTANGSNENVSGALQENSEGKLS